MRLLPEDRWPRPAGADPAPGRPVRLDVPRFPQAFGEQDWPAGRTLRGEGPEYWSGRTCGVACLRMALAHFGRPLPTLFELLAEGLAIDAFTRRGWSHAGLAELARRHGLDGAPRRTDLAELPHLLRDHGPVVVSVGHHLPTDGRRGGHLVVVSGHAEDRTGAHLDVRDPAPSGAEHLRVPAERLAASWTGRAIVLTAGAR